MRFSQIVVWSLWLAMGLSGCQQIETDTEQSAPEQGAINPGSAQQPSPVEAGNSGGDKTQTSNRAPTKVDLSGPPPGWFMAGMAPDDYQGSLDTEVRHGGQHSARLRSKSDTPSAFGTLMQSIEATHYRGSRVRLSGWVKSQDVRGWAGLWMRVDAAKQSVAFDNMQKRPIKGSQDWHQVEVVLDVPRSADVIAFGILLDDRGTVWIDDLDFEKVSRDVPTTDALAPSGLPEGPQNLDFTG